MRSWNLYQVFFVLIALFLSSRTTTGAELDAEQLFDSTRLLEIEISLPEKDWDALCAQSRVRGGFASLFSNTAEKPFTYFKADVKVDGVKIPSVGIRKKGFIGSLDETRPSLKVKFGEYVDQKPVKGLDRLTLNNNKQDTALVSQFLSYKVFNDAGVHAPRVSFARVTVNGEYLGIYSNVESVKKPFLIARYGDSSGNHYEGTLADFYPKTIAKFETKTKTKPQDDPDLKRLSELLHSDDDLPMDEIEKLVDLDSFLKFWAVESLLGFWDGYTQNQNNFFVYDNPANDKFYFMPWGADSCFSPGRRGFGSVGGGPQFESVRAEAMLPNRLFRSEGIPGRYKQALLDVLETAWDEQELLGEVDRIEKLTAGQLHANQKANGGGSPWGGRSLTMDGVRGFIEGRRDEVMSELKDWPVEVPDKPRKPMYTVDVGAVSGSLFTHWAKATDPDDDGKVSEFKLLLNDKKVTVTELTIAAHPMQFGGFGRGRRGPGGRGNWTPPATIVISGQDSADDEPVKITLMMDADELKKPSSKTISVSGSVSFGEQRAFGFGPSGQMIQGTLTLDKSGTDDGAEIAGEFDARIVELHGGMMDRARRGRRGRR